MKTEIIVIIIAIIAGGIFGAIVTVILTQG